MGVLDAGVVGYALDDLVDVGVPLASDRGEDPARSAGQVFERFDQVST